LRVVFDQPSHVKLFGLFLQAPSPAYVFGFDIQQDDDVGAGEPDSWTVPTRFDRCPWSNIAMA